MFELCQQRTISIKRCPRGLCIFHIACESRRISRPVDRHDKLRRFLQRETLLLAGETLGVVRSARRVARGSGLEASAHGNGSTASKQPCSSCARGVFLDARNSLELRAHGESDVLIYVCVCVCVCVVVVVQMVAVVIHVLVYILEA